VNERLLLSRFEIREDGKVVTVRAARTVGEAQQRADGLRAELARRDVHPDVLAFCRAGLLQQNHFHAVLEACKSVSDKLRTLAGETGDGTKLVDVLCFPAAARGSGSTPPRCLPASLDRLTAYLEKLGGSR
jgi:hypothetical protein